MDRSLHSARQAIWLFNRQGPDNIHLAISILNSSTRYQYDLRTQTFQQNALAQQLLRRLASVNDKALQSIHLQDAIRIEKYSRTFEIGTPLTQLIQAGVTGPSAASDVLNAVLEQLGRQTTCVVFADDQQLRLLLITTIDILFFLRSMIFRHYTARQIIVIPISIEYKATTFRRRGYCSNMLAV